MSCKPTGKENCVFEIVADIYEKQQALVDDCCDTSCDDALLQLTGPTAQPNVNTVPFMLYCEGNCQPFEGYGVQRNGTLTNSFFFKVKGIDMATRCAKLELLRGQNTDCKPDLVPCDLVTPANLDSTGACMTVDLDCFCAITCLTPVMTTN